MTRRRHLMCFGDSNTHGTVAMADVGVQRRFRAADRWPGVLAAALGERWQVIEEGQPGRTTVHDDPVAGAHKNGLTVLPALLETHRPLDLVIIMLGTNDLKARFAVPPVDIAESAGRLAGIVTASDAGPDGTAPAVLLVAPTPIQEAGCLAETFFGGAAKSAHLADRYAEIAGRLHIGFLDAGQHAAVDPLDGIHLDRESHRRLGAAIYTQLVALPS